MHIIQRSLSGRGAAIHDQLQIALRGLQPESKLVIVGHEHKLTGRVCHDVSEAHTNARRWGFSITTKHKGQHGLTITRGA